MVVSMKARQFTAFQFNERLPIAKKWMNEATDAWKSWAGPPMPRVLFTPLVILKVDSTILKKIWVFTKDEVTQATTPRR